MSSERRNVTVVSLEIWNAKDLNADQKMILLEIDRMDRLDCCYASNQKFANLLNKSRNRACEILQGLIRSGKVGVTYQEVRGKERRVLTVLMVQEPVESSTAGQKRSKSRQDQSTARQDQSTARQDQSKSRQHNKGNRKERIEKEILFIYTNSTFLKLLSEEDLNEYRTGLGKRIREWPQFLKYFENQCRLGHLPRRSDFVMARLENMIMTWTRNIRKEDDNAMNGYQPQKTQLIK